jgi:hypothetical protein
VTAFVAAQAKNDQSKIIYFSDVKKVDHGPSLIEYQDFSSSYGN